jgi:hypothetical protein
VTTPRKLPPLPSPDRLTLAQARRIVRDALKMIDALASGFGGKAHPTMRRAFDMVLEASKDKP